MRAILDEGQRSIREDDGRWIVKDETSAGRVVIVTDVDYRATSERLCETLHKTLNEFLNGAV